MTKANIYGFTADEAGRLRTIYETPVFSKLLMLLGREAPKLLEGGNTNEILIRSGKSAGWTACVQTILAASDPVSDFVPADLITGPATPSYPPLDADDEWDKQ